MCTATGCFNQKKIFRGHQQQYCENCYILQRNQFGSPSPTSRRLSSENMKSGLEEIPSFIQDSPHRFGKVSSVQGISFFNKSPRSLAPSRSLDINSTIDY